MDGADGMGGRALRIGLGAAVRSRARWGISHGPVRLGFSAAARAGDPMARLLTDPALLADPHPYYDELRATGPVVSGRVAAVTARHDVVSAVLLDADFLSGPPFEVLPAAMRAVATWARDPAVASPIARPSMIVTNGSEHAAYRRLAMKAFTARAIERLRERIGELTDDLLDRMAHRLEGGSRPTSSPTWPTSCRCSWSPRSSAYRGRCSRSSARGRPRLRSPRTSASPTAGSRAARSRCVR